MKIFVLVKTRAREDFVEQIDDTHFKIQTKEMPAEGRANERIIELLSDYLDVPKSIIELISGEKSKIKIFEIDK